MTSGEYGSEFLEKMVTSVDNGRCVSWRPENTPKSQMELDKEKFASEVQLFEEEITSKHLNSKTNGWEQFRILYSRMVKQMWRDSSYMKMRIIMHILLGFLIGGLFFDMGNDASKTLFNFGFCFTIIIFYMYIPMMPVLSECKFYTKLF